MAACTGTSVAPQLQPILSSCLTPSGARSRGSSRASRGRDEDFAPATSHTLSLMAEHYLAASAEQLLDIVEQQLASRLRPLLQCLHLRGNSDWLLIVPISSLQQTLEGRHFRALLRYRLCMHVFPPDARYSSCEYVMDIHGDHALLCCGDAASAGFQRRHRLVQQSLGSILQAFATWSSLPMSASCATSRLSLGAARG